MPGLVDRERETAKLLDLWERRKPAMAVVYGRRRVGKTYFLESFLEGRRGVYFLAADSTSSENLDELLAQVRTVFPDRSDATPGNYPTWRTALRLLCELAEREPTLVILDEFGYLVRSDPAVPSILQAVWDGDALKTRIKLVLCGSELRVLSSLSDYGQPLHGRVDWMHRYEPLDYYDSARFLAESASEAPTAPYPAREMLTAYGIFGGAGRYLDAIDPARTLAENVASLLLDPNGAFHNEGEILLRQEREIRDVTAYNAILGAVASGESGWGGIISRSGVEPKSFPHYITVLQQLGWIVQEKPFEEDGRRGLYRLSENMLKSWYRYVFRHRSVLRTWRPPDAWSRLVEPDLPRYMGSQVFETVCREHVSRFAERYSLPGVMDMGRWWSRRGDVEIDLVARLSDGSHLFGECKWASSPLDIHDLNRLYAKVQAIPNPDWRRNARYALFSAGAFDPYLEEAARRDGLLLIGARELFPGLDLET